MVCLLHDLEAVATLHLTVVALIAGPYILHGEILARVLQPSDKIPHLSPDGLRGPLVHLQDDLACLRQNEPGFEIGEAVGQKDGPCLLLAQSQPYLPAYLGNVIPAVIQMLQVLMEEVSVIHISTVGPHTHLLLDRMVKGVGKHEGVGLRYLTAQTQPDGAKRPDEVVGQSLGPRIVHPPFCLTEKRLMRG